MKHWVFICILLLSGYSQFALATQDNFYHFPGGTSSSERVGLAVQPGDLTQVTPASSQTRKVISAAEVREISEEESESTSLKKRLGSVVFRSAIFCVRTEYLSGYLRASLRLRKHFSPVAPSLYLVLRVLRL